MLQQIINAVVPVAVTALIGVLIAIVKAVGDAGVSFIEQKKAALQVKIGADTYKRNMAFAESVWNLVDENFRISPVVGNVVAAKQAMFETELLKLVPSLTADEIVQLRQAVAGEINKGKAAVTTPAA